MAGEMTRVEVCLTDTPKNSNSAGENNPGTVCSQAPAHPTCTWPFSQVSLLATALFLFVVPVLLAAAGKTTPLRVQLLPHC